MTTTYTDLQARVSRRIIDLPTAVQAEVPKLVNIAVNKLQERHNFRVMEAELAAYTAVGSHTLVSSVGGAAISWPGATGFKEWRGEPYFLQASDGAPRFMTLAPDRSSIWGSFTQGGTTTSDASFPHVIVEEPSSDDFNNRNLSVYPIPDGNSDYSDGEYRITIPYHRYLVPLSAGGDHNWLTDQLSGEEFIVRWATAEGHALNWDWEKYTILTAQSEVHYKDIVNADKRYRLSNVNEWVPHWRGVHQNRTRL